VENISKYIPHLAEETRRRRLARFGSIPESTKKVQETSNVDSMDSSQNSEKNYVIVGRTV